MAFLQLNPRYQEFLVHQGLTGPEHFLDMSSVIVCGHPDRNVARVTLGEGATVLRAFLKREHRVPWKERLRNAADGFGFVAKSGREAATLRHLHAAGVRCPEWMAVGEDDHGRAFLLLRELMGEDLRTFLQNRKKASPEQRRRFARGLGEALAEIHNTGFDHPDLYSKHVLVNPDNQTIGFLDWQRSRRRRQVTWRRRCRDLAALEATLADGLATLRERLVCMRAYLQKSRSQAALRATSFHSMVLAIDRSARQLLGQRRIREIREPGAARAAQGLVWRDGEALCLTTDFEASLAGHIPEWLRLCNLPSRPGSWETRDRVILPDTRQALLICRQQRRFLGGLWAWLRRRPSTSPEVRQAGLFLRLERYGIPVCRLLAFGQQSVPAQGMQSFLLVESPPNVISLIEWLAHGCSDLRQRRHLIRALATTLSRLHDLHCYFGGQPSFAVVQQDPNSAPSIVLETMDRLHRRRRSNHTEAFRDLELLCSELGSAACAQTDQLRFVLSYLGQRKLDAAAKRLASALLNVGWHALSPRRACFGVLHALRRLRACHAGCGFPLRTAEQEARP